MGASCHRNDCKHLLLELILLSWAGMKLLESELLLQIIGNLAVLGSCLIPYQDIRWKELSSDIIANLHMNMVDNFSSLVSWVLLFALVSWMLKLFESKRKWLIDNMRIETFPSNDMERFVPDSDTLCCGISRAVTVRISLYSRSSSDWPYLRPISYHPWLKLILASFL